MSLVLEFASSVVKNLPRLSDEGMKRWVEKPLELQEALEVLCPENQTNWQVYVHQRRMEQGALGRYVVEMASNAPKVQLHSMVSHDLAPVEVSPLLLFVNDKLEPIEMAYRSLSGHTVRDACFRDGKWLDYPD